MTPIAHPAHSLDTLRAARSRIYASRHVLGEDGVPRDVWPVGLTQERGEALRDLAAAERASAMVETGFAYGMSASFLLEAGLLARGDRARLVSIDPFQSTQWKGAGRRHLREGGAAAHHQLIEERSEIALPRLIAEGQRFDLAFVDGDHRFEGAFLDIFFARRLLGDGKLIVVDDAWMPAIQKAAAFFESAGMCRREPTPAVGPLSKFILLRVDARGDDREWDHFTDF